MGVERIPRTISISNTDAQHVIVTMIDQTKLPQELVEVTLTTYEVMIDAIKRLVVRGAPALGVSGAAGLALYACNQSDACDGQTLLNELKEVARQISEARPTAVNLSWGVARGMKRAQACAALGSSVQEIQDALVAETCAILQEDEACCRAIGAYGAKLLAPGCRVLTHCNAGSLATAFYGTALGVIYAAHEDKKIEMVYADETRPVGQGARLTRWELARAGVPVTLLCDNMAASLMAQGKIDAVIVGADRICANGDTANKIGTYGVAVLAHYHHIPVYVAAPESTIDMTLDEGTRIPIEFRDASEVTDCEVEGAQVYNPAFDVTPAALIDAIITNKGVFKPSELREHFQ